MDDGGRGDGAAELSTELVQVLGLPGADALDGSTPLSAPDLRALMNRMQVRSEQVKGRVRHCIASQRHEFGRAIARATASLDHFSHIADDLEPLFATRSGSAGSAAATDPLSLCAKLSDLVEQTRQANRVAAEKRKAIVVVGRISNLHEKLNNAAQQLSQGELVKAAQGLLDTRNELGLSSHLSEEDDAALEEEEMRPYAFLRRLWSSSFSQMSVHLGELFGKAIVLDAKNLKLYIQNEAQVSTLLTAMDKIELLETAFARFADTLLKTVLSFILHDPLKADLCEESSTTGEAVLGWASRSTLEDGMVLALLYAKLLKVVNFLQLYVCCGHDSWMKELGRFIWPRMADAIISGYLSKAVPNEVSEVARFQESATLTNDFEKALGKLNFIPKLISGVDKLGKFASDVELHFASKKRGRVMARTRRLLVRSDFNIFSRKNLERVSEDNRRSSGENRTQLLFQLESCVISHAAKQLMDIVHGVLEDTCIAASRMSVELYHAARDAFLLYSAIVPVKLAKELKSISLEAVIHHNDCLYLAHESLGLLYQYREAFPLELKETCVFVDLFPLFQEMADDVLRQQLQLIGCSLDQALDQGNGFRNTNKILSYEMASLAIDQVLFLLEKVRMIWQPVMIHSTYSKSMGFLMTSAFGRLASEILNHDDMDVKETEQLRSLIFSLEDRLLPMLQSLVCDELKNQNIADAAPLGSLNQIGRLVPTWCKLLRLAELLDMSLVSITLAWENGSLAVSGFSSLEVQKFIKAVFSDTDLRKESLKRVAAKHFP